VDEVQSASGETALVVVDYKSGNRKPTPREAQSDLQLTVYALALDEMLGLPVERVEFHFLRDGLTLESGRDEEAFNWLLGEVLGYASAAVERGRYPACPGYWCRWCDYQLQCQAEGIATGRLGDDSVYREVILDGSRG
jgi:RecB family exonuclease